MACRSVWPDSSTPSEENSSFPTMVTTVSIRMGQMYFTTAPGSSIIPTEMKNTAPNRSLTPEVRCSTRSAWTVPASSEPARNAPSAEEKPSASARSTIPKQMPSDTISSVSSLISLDALFSSVGSRKMPSTSHSTRYSTSSPSCSASAPPEMDLLTEMVDRMIIMKMPAISSITSVPNTSWAKSVFRTFSSSKALMMMVVDDMDSMPPRKMLSMVPQPISCPTAKPIASMPPTSTSAVMMAVPPTLASLWRLNSSPRQNIRMMMPISLHVDTASMSASEKNNGI